MNLMISVAPSMVKVKVICELWVGRYLLYLMPADSPMLTEGWTQSTIIDWFISRLHPPLHSTETGAHLSIYCIYHIHSYSGACLNSSPLSPPSSLRSQLTNMCDNRRNWWFLCWKHMESTNTQDFNISMMNYPCNSVYLVLWWSSKGKVLCLL